MIIDLHCDLLAYLNSRPGASAYDPCVRCSIPQLRAGGVATQVMAVFTLTEEGSAQAGMAQAKIFRLLPERYPEDFSFVTELPSGKIGILLAIENASGFCEEEESIKEGLKRLEWIIQEVARPLYISLTWNGENRFGGGAKTAVGLKEDGKRLLDFLHGKGIAIDFSHTSDNLAADIFRYLDTKNLDIPVLASHSNFRSVTDVPRNLPDEFAIEIIQRKGVIGLTVVRDFVGEDKDPRFHQHMYHGIDLGAENALAFGADFFYEGDIPPYASSNPKNGYFFPQYADASCYPQLLPSDLLESIREKVFHQNILSFLEGT